MEIKGKMLVFCRSESMFPSRSHCLCSPSLDQEDPSEGTRTSTENKYEIVIAIRKPHVAVIHFNVNVFIFSLQGIQFYTQIKTVTSQWKAEDATLKSPAVTMPTMGR